MAQSNLGFNQDIKELKEFISLYQKLGSDLKNAIPEERTKLISVDTKSIKSVEELTSKVKELESAFKERRKGIQEEIKLKKQLKKIKDEEFQQSIKEEKLKQANLKTLADEEKLSQANLKTLAEKQKLIQSNLKTVESEQKVRQQVLKTKENEQKILISEKKEVERVQKAKSKVIKALTEEEKLQERLNKLRSGELNQSFKLKAEINKESKALRDKNKTLLETTSAYKKLTSATNTAQARFKDLAVQFGVNSKQAQNALTRFNKLDTALRKINDTARDGRRDVGRYGIATKGLGSNLIGLGGSLIGGLGVVGGIQMFTQVVTESVAIVRSFASAQSELASILGVTADEISDVTELSKELGSTTAFTATEVTKAATELAKLGFNTNEIKDSLSGVLDGATALGVGIPETASLVASSLKAFGLEASETDRVVSTLAVSTTKTSLDFSKLQTALGNVAPAASAFGASIEETTALLGLITDKGIDASTAGSQLRNIFIKLKSEGLTLDQALDRIANSQDSVTEAASLFGKQGATTALALAEQRDKIDGLTESITGQDEALKNLVEERLNNLDGDLKILQSTWEGLILSFEDGSGVLNDIMRGVVQAATIILNVFTTTNKVLSQFFGTLQKEFKPLIDGIKELFGSFGEFNVVALITETLISRLVIGFKISLLPVRLLFQEILLLKDAFSVVTNEGKKLLNLLGADFDIDPEINISKLQDRMSSIKDVFIDTFTVDELPNPDTTEIEKEIENKGKSIGGKFSNGINEGIEINKEGQDKLTGAIEKQQKVVSDLQTQIQKADETAISGLNQKLALEQEELKRLQDLGKAVDELKEKRKTDADLAIESSRERSIILKERELFLRNQGKTDSEIEEDLSKLKIDLKQAEVDQLKQMGLDSLDAELELAKMKSDLAKKELKEKEANAKAINDLSQKLLDKAIERANAESEAKQKVLEDEISDSQKAQDTLRGIIGNSQGIQQQEALQSLQEEKALEEEKTRALEDEKKKQIRVEMFLSGIKLLTANAGKPNPAGTTITQATAVASTLLDLIPAFKDGTEDTGEHGRGLDGQGGFLSMLHSNERVMDETNNAKTKGLSNNELGDLAEQSMSGQLVPIDQLITPPPIQVERFDTTAIILDKMDRIEKSIKSIDIPEVSQDVDFTNNLIVHKTKRKNTHTTKLSHLR